MELIHSTFQASFNARIERLAEQEENELRTIFRYHDTDGDGAVSADQACRIFGLLGLDVNPAHVLELGEVYLAEFLKIVDSHMPVPAASPDHAPARPSDATSTTAATVVPPLSAPVTSTSEASPDSQPVDPTSVAAAEAAAIQLRNAQLWEDEWRVVDSYRRGFVTHDELRLFLRSCFSPFPLQDLDRFLEVYSDPNMPEDEAVLTKWAFLKFRRDYTERELAQSEHGLSSDDEEEDSERVEGVAQGTFGSTHQDAASQPAHADGATSQQTKKRRASRANSISHGDHDNSGDVEGIVIDPGVMDDDVFVDEDEPTGVEHDALHDITTEDAHGELYQPLPHELADDVGDEE